MDNYSKSTIFSYNDLVYVDSIASLKDYVIIALVALLKFIISQYMILNYNIMYVLHDKHVTESVCLCPKRYRK